MSDATRTMAGTLARSAAHVQARGWRAWAVWAMFFAAIALLIQRPWRQTAVPAAATVAAREFSAERAWVHLDALATKLGRRVAGTAACAEAADYIEAALRGLGVQTERQVASGTIELDGTTYVYRGVVNVLARIPGRSAGAILVSAHYDSAAEGPGAGDNALGVAAALEVARALQAGGPPAATIVFNFNGGEELGLLGAHAFVDHPWRQEVAGFINLDASGGQGRQLLVRSTPGRAKLLEAYAALAPHVHGTVLAEEIFGLLPFDTDFRIYRDAGLGGLDLAPYGDSYAYHSARDRAERVSPRTLQDSGENLLAILRGLPGLGELRAADGSERAAPGPYYDVLGLVMVHYSAATALAIGLLVALLALALAAWPGARAERTATVVALGVTSVGLSALLAILVPLAGAVVITLSGFTMSWYARPWVAVGVYGPLTLLGVLIGQGVLRGVARRRGVPCEQLAEAARRGLVVFWAGLLTLTGALGLGSAYLPLWWCVASAIALLASMYLAGARCWLATLAGTAMAGLLTAQAAELLLTTLVPLTGMLGADAPVEVLVAAVTAAVLAPFALVLAPVMQAAVSLRRVAAWSAIAVATAAGLVAVSFPYSETRPKRVYVDVSAGVDGNARVAFETIDPGPGLAVTPAQLTAKLRRPPPRLEVLPAAPEVTPPPGEANARELRLIATGAYLVEVRLDGAIGGLSVGTGAASSRHLIWVGTDDPLRLRVDKASAEPVHVRVKSYYLGSDVSVSPALEQLPRWTVPSVQTVLETSATL
jgi:hypothetical protein